jgi:THO complex subunit 2
LELYHDAILFTKLVRVLNAYMTAFDSRYPNSLGTADYLPILVVFLSALGFVPMNTGLVYEIWDLMSRMSFERRYSVYKVVRVNGYNNHYKMLGQYHLVGKEMKAFLRRLSKDNMKLRGRVLARMAHSNPIIVCVFICEQAANYDNQIPVLIDVLRYVTPLLHDIMTFCIMDRLTQQTFSRLKDDGSTIASWLSNLASFSGQLYKKYSSTDLEPLINYVVNKIQEGGWEDLVILRELVQHMAGVEIIDDTVSAQQLEAHAGSDTLRAECGGFSNSTSIIPRTLKRSIVKLKDTVLESGKGRMMLLLLAKLRGSVTTLFDERELPNNHLILVTDSFDKCHEALLLLLRFFERNAPILIETENAIAKPSGKYLSVPNVERLVSYKIDPEVAFAIVRKGLTFLPTRKGEKDITLEERTQIALREIGDVTKMIPEEMLWKVVSKELYTTFWALDLYDIYVPTQTYNDSIEKLTKELEEVKRNSSSSNKKRADQIEGIVKNLNEDLYLQTKNHQRILEYFKSIKDSFFDQTDTEKISNYKIDFMVYFCQYCILPRCTMSSSDALYCAKFVELLHMVETPVFNTLQYLMKVSSSLIPSFLQCSTEQEALRIAGVLRSNFEMVEKWIQSEDSFKAACNKPGFRKFIDKEPENKIQLKEFQSKILFKAHEISTEKYLSFLSSDNYNLVRCALIVLTNLGNTKVYPKYRKDVSLLMAPTEKLKKQKADNVKVLASRYHSILVTLDQTLPDEPPPTPTTPAAVTVFTPTREPKEPSTPTVTITAATSTPTREPKEPSTPTEKPAPPKDKAFTPEPPKERPPAEKPTPPPKDNKKVPFTPPAPPLPSQQQKKKSRSPSPAPPSGPPPQPPSATSSAEELRKQLLESKKKNQEKGDGTTSRKSRSPAKDSRRDSRGSDNRSGKDSNKDVKSSPRDQRDQTSSRNEDQKNKRDSRGGYDNRDHRDNRDNRGGDNRDNNSNNRDNHRDNRDNRDSRRDSRGNDNKNTSDSRKENRNRDSTGSTSSTSSNSGSNRDRGTKRDREPESDNRETTPTSERDNKRRRTDDHQPRSSNSSRKSGGGSERPPSPPPPPTSTPPPPPPPSDPSNNSNDTKKKSRFKRPNSIASEDK